MGLKDHRYDFFEMEFLNEFPAIWLKNRDLVGVNVTVPHKENVLRFLDRKDLSAIKVGAVNVVHRSSKELVGYNTDYLAFKESLLGWLPSGFKNIEALILGSGGASKAVQAALSDLGIEYSLVSRTKKTGDYSYQEINDRIEVIERFKLIINTTPLGMHPHVEQLPELPYMLLGKGHYLYDLIYNPEETAFLRVARKRGAKVKNGLEMLELQAEKSWVIWNGK